MSTRVLLADDHAMVREGVKAVIQEKFDVVGEARNGVETVRLAKKLSPHVIIMDIGMPDLNGIEATRQIVRDNAAAKIIALSVHGDQQYVAEMLRAGASGYILKRSAAEEVITAIRTVTAGRTYLSPDLVGVEGERIARCTSVAKEPAAFKDLTVRQREVLQVIAEGKANKNIADDLALSIKTVEKHRHNIMQKLNIHTTAELTKYAIRQGITSTE